MEPQATHPGIIWSELMSRDPAKSARFYEEVVGLAAVPAGEGADNYWILLADGQPVGGLTGRPADTDVWPSGGPSGHWIGYFSTANVEAASSKAEGLGATVLVGPLDIPGVGTVAVVRDPDQAVFGLFRPSAN
jgi:predicted enzyme related to lactoylglutathione lyase